MTATKLDILKEGIVAVLGLQKDIKKADPKRYPFLFFYIGRSDWIRTSDFLHPMQALYQAELHSGNPLYISAYLKMQAKKSSCFLSKILLHCAHSLIIHQLLSYGKRRAFT